MEQNLGVAVDVADTVAVMVNGRIARVMPAAELAADTDLQQRLLGVRARGDEEESEETVPALKRWDESLFVYTVKRAGDADLPRGRYPLRAWHRAPCAPSPSGTPATRSARRATAWFVPTASRQSAAENPRARQPAETPAPRLAPVAATAERAAYIAGTFDTKGRELLFIRNCLERLGVRTVTVDLSTSGKPSSASVSPAEVARHHPRGAQAVFTGDRGSAVVEMGNAFERFIGTRRDLGGIISAGGSGGTALATAAMRRLPIGVPKVMVSTVASGDVKPYVGPADICMMYAVTDVSGINRISERVLSNAAHALAGMILNAPRESSQTTTKPAIGLTMFGVTTPCVQAVTKALEEQYDCLTFHATGTGGQSMEKLVDSGLLAGVIDVTTTEIADELVGGVFSAGPERMDAIIRSRVPYVGSCGALDMVNFHAMDTVPAQFRAPQPVQAQPERDTDAHHPGGEHGDRRVHRRQAQPHGRARAVPHPRGRGVAHRRARQGVLGSGGRPGAVRRHRVEVSRRPQPPADPAALQRQRSGVRAGAGGSVPGHRGPRTASAAR